jgi:hypothetical protein
MRRHVRRSVSPGNDGAVSPDPLGLIKGHDLLHDLSQLAKKATNFVDGPLSTQEWLQAIKLIQPEYQCL